MQAGYARSYCGYRPESPSSLNILLALNQPSEEAERLFAGMEVRLHGVPGFFGIPAADRSENLRVLAVRILLNSGQLLRLADPLREDSAYGREEFVEHLVFGALGDREVEFDVEVDVIAAAALEAARHFAHDRFQPFEILRFSALRCQGRDFPFENQADFADILQFLVGFAASREP